MTKKKATIKRSPSTAAVDQFVNAGSTEAVAPPPVVQPAAPVEKRSVGRPHGKRSDPNYGRLTAWLPKALAKDLKMIAEYDDAYNDVGDVLESLIDLETIADKLRAVGINR